MTPLFCNYYVTLRCNSRCQFCNIWKSEDASEKEEQGIPDIRSNLGDLKRLGVRLVDFTGGEPLLYPHLVDALRMAKDIGLYTSVTTNCLLYPKYASDLKGMVDILQFSMESADEAKHNEIRGVDSYKKVMESIDISKHLKQKAYLIHTVTNGNYLNVPEMIRFAQEKKCVLALNPCFEYFENEGLSSQAASGLKKYHREPYVVVDLANLKFISRGGNDPARPKCRAVKSSIVISPDNYLILPCYHHSIKKIKIDNNLYDLYKGEELNKWKSLDGTFDFCKNCTINCYSKGSLYRFYPFLTMRSLCKYSRERLRRQY